MAVAVIEEVVIAGRSAWRKRCLCGSVVRIQRSPVQCETCGRYVSKWRASWASLRLNDLAFTINVDRIRRENARPLFFKRGMVAT